MSIAAAPQPKPLSELGLLLAPLARLLLRGTRRAAFEARLRYTLEYREQLKAFWRLRRQIEREAALYGRIIIERLSGMGFNWVQGRGRAPDEAPRRRRRAIKVRFERVYANEYAIWYKILIRRATLFKIVNGLPYRVTVADLLSDETCLELSFACQRTVKSFRDDPRRGAWLILYRNDGVTMIPKLVKYRTLLPYFPADYSRAHLILGVGENNVLHEVDLENNPHILIAGATRSGKSNQLHQLLCSLIRFSPPDSIRFLMIDPKKVELSLYRTLPYLARPVVYDAEDAVAVLQELSAEIDRRTDLMMALGTQNMVDYNRVADEPLPRLVCVIEELASLWTSDRERDRVHKLIQRVANMGRACGIHLIVCTQLPLVTVVPSIIRVNFWVKLCGKVNNGKESQVVLGRSGAQNLPRIPGRMLYGVDAEIFELQTPLCTIDDIREALAIARGRSEGLIDLVGYEPRVILPALVAFAYDHADGTLHTGTLAPLVQDYAISRAMLKTAIEDLARVDQVEHGERVFSIERRGSKLYVRLVEDRAPRPEPPPRYLELPEPPRPVALLMPPLPPPPKDDSQVAFELWVAERLEFVDGVRTKSAELQADCKRWFEQRGLKPLSAKTWGSEMRRVLKVQPHRASGGTHYWLNVRLRG